MAKENEQNYNDVGSIVKFPNIMVSGNHCLSAFCNTFSSTQFVIYTNHAIRCQRTNFFVDSTPSMLRFESSPQYICSIINHITN